MQVVKPINVNYESTNDPKQAIEWLSNLPDLFSADFEAAVRYTEEEVKHAKVAMYDTDIPKIERIGYQAIAKASALGHPSHVQITHCSVAWSDRDAYVFIIDSQDMADAVLDFLVTTDATQVWHNYGYDGRLIRYYQRTDVKNLEDTQILAKTLLNHVETFKARTGLKDLAGHWYGDWGISADNFTIEQQYQPHVLKYAAIDACATYKLWTYLMQYVKEEAEQEEQ